MTNGPAGSIVDGLASGDPWWDWYEVGGRWSGYFARSFPHLASTLASGDVLPIAAHPAETMTALDTLQQSQDGRFLECRDHITGATVYPSDGSMTGYLFGMPVAVDAEAAERVTAGNQETARDWQEVLSARSLLSVPPGLHMSMYYARRLCDLVDGVWCPDSLFYDTLEMTSRLSYSRAEIEQRLTSGTAKDLALVAVDFHY